MGRSGDQLTTPSVRTALSILLGLAVLAGAIVGWQQWQRLQAERARERALQEAHTAATAFATAWENQDWDRLPAVIAGPAGPATTAHATSARELQATAVTVTTGAVRLEDRERPRLGASAPAAVTWRLDDVGELSYDVTLELRPRSDRPEEGWAVAWSPTTLHPELDDQQHLAADVTEPPPAALLDAAGTELNVTGTQLTRYLDTLRAANAERLKGAPSAAVRIITGDGGSGAVLRRYEGRDPEPVRTAIDPALQRAAEAALTPVDGNAAIVVLDPASGGIRAVANRPGGGFDRALSGRYAPGSTFKVVAAAAFLRDGVMPQTPISCPAEVAIGGKTFTNFQGEAFGVLTFREAFYRSCNTAFVQLAAALPDGALERTAAAFGFGAPWGVTGGDPSHAFPDPVDVVERAAAAFGQARVEASPVAMAGVAAAVSAGRWRPPAFVPDADHPSTDLSDVAPTLTDLMLEVPRIGTAAGSGVPDGVAGKTGTAEYGSGDPLPTHAWFIGFDPRREDPIAFAILVEGGRSGGAVAAPVAARLLAALG